MQSFSWQCKQEFVIFSNRNGNRKFCTKVAAVKLKNKATGVDNFQNEVMRVGAYIEDNVCTRMTNCFGADESVSLVVVFRIVKGNKHQSNTRVSA